MQLHGTFKSFFGAIAVPILDKGDGTISNVTHDWANAAAALGGGLAVTVLRLQTRNKRVDLAKERLAEMAIANNAQFIFFLDDDVVPPPDALMKMIELWRSDPKYSVISGVYWSKSEPSVPLIFRDSLEGSYWDWTIQDLIKADAAGAGCLFVDTDVFKKLSKPWFSVDYYYEDPRTFYDTEKWRLTDALGSELLNPSGVNEKHVQELEAQLKKLGKDMHEELDGKFNPNLMINKKRDSSTTEDIYFFKKIKEELGEQLWIDCSIQCQHQDKRTGRMFGIRHDMPQARPRYEGEVRQMKPGDAIVLDIGAGDSPYYVEDGFIIKVDNNPKTNPHILADARTIPVQDCYADVVIASHVLEHFSFKETVGILKEWSRLLKVGGKMMIVVPNLRWASKRILDEEETMSPDEAERSMFMYYSGQAGTLREANLDFHKAGFTPKSLRGVLGRIPGLKVVDVVTSDGNVSNWKEHTFPDETGYNIIAIVEKEFHNAPVSIKMNIPQQEAAKKHVGEKAKDFDLDKDIKAKKAEKKVTKKKVGRPKKKVGRPKKKK